MGEGLLGGESAAAQNHVVDQPASTHRVEDSHSTGIGYDAVAHLGQHETGVGEQILMSHSRARWNDPPIAQPWMAAITGASISHNV